MNKIGPEKPSCFRIKMKDEDPAFVNCMLIGMKISIRTLGNHSCGREFSYKINAVILPT